MKRLDGVFLGAVIGLTAFWIEAKIITRVHECSLSGGVLVQRLPFGTACVQGVKVK